MIEIVSVRPGLITTRIHARTYEQLDAEIKYFRECIPGRGGLSHVTRQESYFDVTIEFDPLHPHLSPDVEGIHESLLVLRLSRLLGLLLVSREILAEDHPSQQISLL